MTTSGFIDCPKGQNHNAMVVVTAVMGNGRQVPRRAICATCRHDWDPSTGMATFLPPEDDFSEPGPGELSDAEQEEMIQELDAEQEDVEYGD